MRGYARIVTKNNIVGSERFYIDLPPGVNMADLVIVPDPLWGEEFIDKIPCEKCTYEAYDVYMPVNKKDKFSFCRKCGSEGVGNAWIRSKNSKSK